MSFLAKLEIEGNTYNLLKCSYEFNKSTDESGCPEGLTSGGELTLEIESKGDSLFIDWMLAANKTKDGIITFFRRDAMSKLQEIHFTNGFCISMKEQFDAIDHTPMRIGVRLSAQKINFGLASYENAWKL